MVYKENTGAVIHSFRDYLFKDSRNKRILSIAAIIIIIQFTIFKYLYPYANFLHDDSFAYLIAANENLKINTYLIGYSRFLRLFSVFSSSDMALAAFQYLLIQTSSLFFLFTVFYFYRPSKLTKYVLLIFMVGSPLLLHLSNIVSSDCLFAALSLTWFTLLLWLVHKPSRSIIIWEGVSLFLAFTVRYNALIYPFITFGVLLLIKSSIRQKLFGIIMNLLLCCLFISFTTYKYKQLTGYWQYSPFSGWQLANNAMYAYRYVDSSDRKPVPKKFQVLDNMIRTYFDSTHDLKRFPYQAVMAGTYYMWSPSLPLMKYKDIIFNKDTLSIELKRWASMAPLYKSYGFYIIRQYPWHFMRYFIWPNANRYYAPSVEFLAYYNWDMNSVKDIAKEWFGYKTKLIKTRMRENKVWVLDFYPILSGISNILFLFLLISFIILKGWQYGSVFSKGILLASIFWLLNAGFTIGASTVALRFQVFPILLSITFTTLLVDWVVQLLGKLQFKTNTNPEIEKHMFSNYP